MTAPRFDVKLLPCGLRATVAAPTVTIAAEMLHALTPANEALVRRIDDGYPHGTPECRETRVIFGHDCAVHFIGFRGEEYHAAVRAFGLPDVWHRRWDLRARREIGEGDLLVFARGDPEKPSPYNFDDSNESDDPAAQERLQR